ncbi:HNH endonuclease [Rhizobiales bacterium GAS113]|nr:HNH endonuclease [Rhizobiales bacterium GAS113]
MATVALKDVVTAPEKLMGVKAVWGRSAEAVMCFGSRGNPALKDKGHFSQARTTAERALNQPYFLTIGGGEHVPGALRGRVLELIRATGVYGETTAFVRDENLRNRLAQWPVAIIVSEVYSVSGEPQLVEDLGFPDRRILANAYDTVIRDEDQVHRLWAALKDWKVERRWGVTPPPGFRDPGKVEMYGSMYPKLLSKSAEGERVWKLQQQIERDPKLKREAKARNRATNGGVLICEACGFSDPLDPMFDAHHQQPLAAGVRESRVDDLVVLCPTCHRWAHAKASDKLSPVPVGDIARPLSGPSNSDA